MTGLHLGLGLSSAMHYDPASQAYFNAMAVQPGDARKALIDALIRGLRADGVWARLDWFCLMAAHDEQAGRLNARNVAKALTAVNSPAFTVDRGFTGDAISSHLTLGELLNAAGNQLSQDSASLGYYCNQQNVNAAAHWTVTTPSPAPFLSIRARADGVAETSIVNNNSTLTAAVSNSRLGHRAITRTGTNAAAFYKAGVSVGTTATASTGVPATILTILRDASIYCPDRLACVWTGAGMNSTEMEVIHARLTTYLTAIGAN